MPGQNISTSNITMFMSELKLGTFNMHISLPMTTSLIASQNRFRTQNFKSLLLICACVKTFQLEGGCWNLVGKVTHQCFIIQVEIIPFGCLWVHVDTNLSPQSFISYFECD